MRSFNLFLWKSLVATALFLTLIACGKRAQVQPTLSPVTPTPPPDFAGLVNIGGRKMYLECRGTGSPIVILESGYRNDADIWKRTGRTRCDDGIARR
jgi:hypothetical protein